MQPQHINQPHKWADFRRGCETIVSFWVFKYGKVNVCLYNEAKIIYIIGGTIMRKIRYKVIYAVIAIVSIAVILSSCDQLPPKIEQGEFPFSLKYKLNGEIHEVKDTVICEFAGFDVSGGFGKYRSWNEYLKSGTDRISILHNENVHSVLNPQRVDAEIEVYFDYGEGMYYMGDPNAKSAIHAKPHICYVETYNESPNVTRTDATPLTEKQLKEYFDIEIIELSFSKPINNTFK